MKQEDINRRNLEERVRDLSGKTVEYQKIINELSSEVHRLNELLKTRMMQASEMEGRINQLIEEKGLLEQRVGNEEGNRKRVEDYENKLAMISLEVERLNNNLKVKSNEKSEADREI